MLSSEYRQYIASERWLQRRKLFLSAHQNCNRCGISSDEALKVYDQRLHVHHKNYQHIGCELDDDLEALCRRCHEIESLGSSRLLRWMTPADRNALEQLLGRETREAKMTPHGLAGVFGGPLED